MKKLARLTALLLTGALLLVLTACGGATGAETEQQAKQRLLKEINSYRESLDPSLAPLVEVELLSEAEQELIEHFRTAGKNGLSEDERAEALNRWNDKTDGWSYCDDFGWDWDGNESVYILSAKVPANTPKGNEALQATLRSSGKFDNEACKYIGIGVVTIDGQMYWTCAVYD